MYDVTQSPDTSDIRQIVPDALFVNHCLLSTHNTHQARASVERVFFKHALRPCNNVNPVNFIHRGASLGSLTFNLISYGADVEVSVNDINRSHYIVVVPLSGRAEVKNHDEVADIETGSVVVLDPLSRFRFKMQADHSHLAIGIPKQRLNAQVSKYSHQVVSGWMEFQHRPYLVKDLGSSLYNFIEYICKEVDRPGAITARNAVAMSIEETFMALFVSTLLDGYGKSQNFQDMDLYAPLYIRNAEAFMEANLTDNITVNDIAYAVDAPLRTLHYGYKKYRGVSPGLWLKTRRLRQARFDLLDSEQLDTSITEISHRYQQPNAGRFSSAYFKEFGEYPSDTRKRRLA